MSVSPIIFSIKRGEYKPDPTSLAQSFQSTNFNRNHNVKPIPQSYNGRGLIRVTVPLFAGESVSNPFDLSKNEVLDVALGETINNCQVINLMPASTESNFGPETSDSQTAKLRNDAFRNVAEAFFRLSGSDIAYSSVNYDENIFDVDGALTNIARVRFALLKPGLVSGLENNIHEVNSLLGRGSFNDDVISFFAGDFPFALDPYSEEACRGYGGNPLEDFHRAIDRVVSRLTQAAAEKNT